MVIEVGLGGTWDCTNVVHGDVAVLTNVSFDHTDVLGPTLEGIAADKAGIIEPGSRVVVGETRPRAGRDRAPARPRRSARPSVWVAGRDFGCASQPGGRGRPAGHAVDAGRALRRRARPAARRPPGRNAAVALAAAEAFFGEPLDPDVVEEGFAAVRVPGRLEVLGRRPLLLVDGAHNAAGMAALGDALDRGVRRRGRRRSPSSACCSGRDPSAMLAPLARRRRARRRGLRAGLAARHAGAASGRGRARARSRRPRGARRARRARAWPGGWSTPTASSSWPVRSTWSARRGPTCSASAVAVGGRRSLSRRCVVSTPRGPHPCHREARRRRARPGRRDRQPPRAQEAAPGGGRAAHHHQGGGRDALRRARRAARSSATWWPSSPARPRSSWWSRDPKDTYAVVRLMMGATNPAEAAPGTIRGDLGIETTENLVHGSDSHESAAREIALFFPDLAAIVGAAASRAARRGCNPRSDRRGTPRPPCGRCRRPVACGRTVTGAGPLRRPPAFPRESSSYGRQSPFPPWS